MRLARIVTAGAIALELITACGYPATTMPPRTPMRPAPGPVRPPCRTYARAWKQTSTLGVPLSVTARFNTATRVYSESVEGTGFELRETTYLSLSDFVDEAGILGGRLFARSARCPDSAGCFGVLRQVETPAYDLSRSPVGVLESVYGVPVFADTFTRWDRSGRPVSGHRSQPGVCDVPLTLAYDDAARTVTESASESAAGRCDIASTSRASTYDADGNVLSESSTVGGTTTTVVHAITATTWVCK